jgi:uncharacterized protein (DUF1697 family)
MRAPYAGAVDAGTFQAVRTTRYVALLRGINVGGRNKVAMADLRAAFESAGHRSVATYIQSGNVLFETDAPRRSMENDVEAMLERRVGFPVVVVIRSQQQLGRVVDEAPAGFGTDPAGYHSDVVFLRSPLTPTRAMRVVELRAGVDQAWPGPGVIYFARLNARLTASRMGRIVGTPEYQEMTIRSWSTVTKLHGLLADR